MLAMRDRLQGAGFKPKTILVAGGLALFGAGTAGMAQPASASTISLTDSWTEGTATHQTGSLPTLSTTANQSTSNLGTVSPLSNPKTQSLAQGVATSGEALFVAVPNGFGTNEADIPITFTLSDGIGSIVFTDYINYYANYGTDTDDLAWTTSPASSPGYLSSAASFVQTETLSDGVMVQVQLPYETDWNMGQQITFDYTGNSVPVPEPASVVLFSTALLGLGAIRRRNRM
jgi:hypothetical protein